jgi:hypothetical protein
MSLSGMFGYVESADHLRHLGADNYGRLRPDPNRLFDSVDSVDFR